ALGVVFYHTDFRLPGDWHTEFFGVSTFFVISGFITRDPDGGDTTARGFLPRPAGEKPRPARSRAVIAAISGLVPTMFMTRVRL
ncbi:hypothetical protein, partial [Bradyrhizobium sp.]|uniref:hypothetical protein n=1 Tax=Bradyrhizobium sp. TaxID=376 RepID=UPI003C663B45